MGRHSDRRRRRSQPIDDRPISVVSADDTVITILVYPDGKVTMITAQPPRVVAEALEKLRDSVLARAARAEQRVE